MKEVKARPNKAIFLDRDGVINHDPGEYTRSVADFSFLPGVEQALKNWQHQGFLLIVITNQGGIAKEEYSLQDFFEMDRYMRDSLRSKGVFITATYFCPHHDLYGKCLCRKPAPGMIEKALAVHHIDPAKSVMIGDKYRDIEAAEKAGVRGIKVEVNADLREVELPAL